MIFMTKCLVSGHPGYSYILFALNFTLKCKMLGIDDYCRCVEEMIRKYPGKTKHPQLYVKDQEME